MLSKIYRDCHRYLVEQNPSEYKKVWRHFTEILQEFLFGSWINSWKFGWNHGKTFQCFSLNVNSNKVKTFWTSRWKLQSFCTEVKLKLPKGCLGLQKTYFKKKSFNYLGEISNPNETVFSRTVFLSRKCKPWPNISLIIT